MRKTGIKLAGLAVALVGAVGAEKAEANDVTISTGTTTPVVTASPDGVSPGDVTIASGGAITITTGQSAITLNSNNDIINNGGAATGIISLNADNTVGIRIVGGFNGNVANNGPIVFTESYAAADSDNDGDLDGEWAQGTGRFGILLQPGLAHTGNITHGSTGGISIEGDNGSGMQLEALLIGNLTSSGDMTLLGDNTTGIAILGGLGAGVNGNVIISDGDISLRGVGARGLFVDAPISGELSISGIWSVSGFHQTTRPLAAAIAKLDADDLLLSGAAIEVRRSVGQGITIEGIGVEDDEDDDGDGVTETAGDTNDDLTAGISVFSNAPALLISADPGADLVLGATSSGHGLNIRGGISAQGVYDNIESTAVRIQGSATSNTTTAGGILIDGNVFSGASEADTFGVVVGRNAIVPSFVVRKGITASVGADGVADAFAVLIEDDATVTTFVNDGAILAQAFGEVSNAHAIVDRSNTLASITNTGAIRAQTIPTDDDASDDIIPIATGDTIAIDVSLSSIGVTLTQNTAVVFTDQDSTDGDVTSRPEVLIEGDVLFGSGSDTFNLLSGAMIGDVDFGAGATNTFVIDNDAVFLGRIANSGGLTIDVINGSLAVDGGQTNLTSAHFRANSGLSVLLSEDVSESTHLIASGAITFDPGAFVTPLIPTGLPQSGSNIFLTANGGLIGGSNVERVVTGPGAPWIYNLAVEVTPDNLSLQAAYILKTTAELGLNPNESAAFDPILDALRQNDDASAALALLFTQEAFETAYDDLLPTFSAGATELAATAIQQSQSAATNRLAATRLHDIDEVSVWVQEIGYGLTRTPQTTAGVEFRGFGFGLAGGIDGPLDNGGLFGVSASFLTSQIEEPGRPDGELAASFGQANAYLGTALGPFDIDLVAGAGVGRMSSLRGIEIGSTFRASSEADWWAYEGHGAVRASLPLRLTDNFIVTPHAALTYVALNETGYTESGGGAAFDYDVDSSFSQRLWADVGLELSARWRLGGEGMIAPRLMVGYRANVLDGEEDRAFRFASGGSEFTLTDEGTGGGAPLVGLGIDATNGFSTFSIAYEGEFGDEIDRHSLNAAIRFRF